MHDQLILLAGYPATGKSTLTEQILNRYPNQFHLITPDEIKEEVWDEIGFSNAEEKAELEKEVWRRFYQRLENSFRTHACVLSDYPFSDKQKPTLTKLSRQYGYHVITIRLVGDPKVIYQRSYQRDLSPNRHLGHLVTRYHHGDILTDRSTADALVNFDTFMDRCRNKGYDSFAIGDLIHLDATDLAAINYCALMSELDSLLVSRA